MGGRWINGEKRTMSSMRKQEDNRSS